MTTHIRFIFMIVAMSLLAACGGHANDEPEPVNPPEPSGPPTAETGRTVLVYMVANNNLHTNGAFDQADLDEMQLAVRNGDIGDGKLVVYHALNTGIVLKQITPEGVDTLKVYDKSELSVSANRMLEVINDTRELAPSKEFGMIFWSHASGWLQDGIAEAPATSSPMLKSFGVDGVTNGKRMNITSLANVLEQAKPDFVYFDCCYMGSVEVMYQLRDAVPWIAASAAEDPADGMPYHLTLEHFFNPDLDAQQLLTLAAKTTFDYYNDVFEKGDCPCTLVVVDSSKITDLATATKRIYEKAKVMYVDGYNYQRYQTSNTCYYFDLEDYVLSICNDAVLFNNWKIALNEAVVYHDATPWIWWSFPINTSCGLSTYIMKEAGMSDTKNYNTLAWFVDVASALL